MDEEQERIFKLTMDVSKQLNLSYETQDWGIINADALRINEFINFYHSNPAVAPFMKSDFLELIIASYNKAILDGIDNQPLQKVVLDFVQEIKDCPWILKYWKSIADDNEFPVGNIL